MVGPGAQGGGAHLRSLARGGGLNLVGAIVNQAALLLIMAALARALGSSGVGRYAECYALLTLLGLLSLAGFRAGMTRFVAINLADGEYGALRGTVRLGLGVTVLVSTVIGVALVVFSRSISQLFHDPALVTGICLVGLTLPASTFSDAALAATQGWRTQRPFTLVGRVYEPLTRLALTVVALLLGTGLNGTLWALAIGAWSAAALAAWTLLRRLRRLPSLRPRYHLRPIFGFSMVSWVSALAATGLIWADTLLLGHMASDRQVGVYNVATRLVMLAVFVMAPINAAFSPQIAHLHHTGQSAEMARSYGSATSWIVRLSMPAFVLLLVFPADLLHLFGRGFLTGATVTAILAVGQLVNAASGPCGSVLNMSGRVWLNMVDNVGVLILNVGLNLVLIPRMGAVGAAVAWSASLVVANLVKVLQVRFVVGTSPSGAGIIKGLAAAAPSLVAAVAVHHLVSSWPARLALGGVVIAGAYLTTVLLLGLNDDDRMMVQAALGRRRRPARHEDLPVELPTTN